MKDIQISMLIRSSLICLTLIVLAGCGFSPMYGKKNMAALEDGILIEAPKNAMGQQLQQDLEDQLNPNGIIPAKPKYKLSVDVTYASGAIGVARDGTASRFNINMTSAYTLVRLSDNVKIQSGTLHHVSSYNNQINQYYSTFISERDSIRRGITELAELYRQRIGIILLKEGQS